MSVGKVSNISQSIMQAIRVAAFGGIENLKLEKNVAVPIPQQNEVLIRVSAAGVNPVDTYIRSGAFAHLPSLPYTPGSDAAGIVEAVGSGVTKFKKGDRVFTVRTVSGAYGQYATAEQCSMGHLSDKLSFSQGAAIGIPYYTAIKALCLRGETKPGMTVLIHGASGAVGLAAVQLAKSLGLRVAGTAGTKEGMDLVKQCGADFVFNHREEGYIQAFQTAVGGADIVLEMLSNVNLQKDLDVVNPRGRIMVIGCRGPIEINPRSTMAKESSIIGVNFFSSTEAEWTRMHQMVEEGQTGGWLVPHVGRCYSLQEASVAHHDVINNTGTQGKLVLNIQ